MNINKCVVFDFDCTITYRHFFYFMFNFDQFLSTYMSNFGSDDPIFLFDDQENDVKQEAESILDFKRRINIFSLNINDKNRLCDKILAIMKD